jgi:superfamily II RNA helicase
MNDPTYDNNDAALGYASTEIERHSLPRLTTVPRDLYYHEVAYVRGLEADNERLRAIIKDYARGMGDEEIQREARALEGK